MSHRVATTGVSACSGREATGHLDDPLPSHSNGTWHVHLRSAQTHPDMTLDTKCYFPAQFWKVLAGLVAESQTLRLGCSLAPLACVFSPPPLNLSPAQPPRGDGFPPPAWRAHAQTGVPPRGLRFIAMVATLGYIQ